MFNRTPPESVRLSSSITLLTPSATSTVLAPETLRTSNATARWPSMNAASRASSCVSSIRATCPKRTGMPPRTVTARLAKSSGFRTRPCTRTRFSLLPRSTRPAGTSSFSRLTAATTMSGETPRASMRSGCSSTWISRLSPPTRATLPTPGMFSIRRLTTSSASRVSSRMGQPWPRTARLMMGCCAGSAREMMGGSMSVGRSSRMASILARTSAWASMILVPRLNWTKMVEKPSVEVDCTCLTPSTGFTASSIFLVTSRSTDSGLAPGYRVWITRNGKSTSGKRSMLSRRYENRPSTTRAMIIIVARTGRLMDRSLRNTGSALPAHDFHQVADLEPFHRPHDGDVAFLEALGDLDQILHLVEGPGDDVAPRHPSRLDHQHVAGALLVATQAGPGHRHGPFHFAGHHPTRGEEPGHDAAIGVRDLDVDLHLSRRGVRRGVDPRHACRGAGALEPGDGQHRGRPHLHGGHVFARHGSLELQLPGVDQSKQRVAVLDPVAGFVEALGDHSGDRGADRGFLQPFQRPGFGGFRVAEGQLRGLHVALRDGAFPEQALHPLVVGLGDAALGPCAGGLGRQRLGRQPGQHLPLAHRLPFLHQHPLQHFGRGGVDPDIHRRVERPRDRDAGDQVRPLHGPHVVGPQHRRRPRGRGGLRLARFAPATGQASERQGREQRPLYGYRSHRHRVGSSLRIVRRTCSSERGSTLTGRPSARSSWVMAR